MKKFAIIVAGGSGNRMQSLIPKQFLPLAGKPVLLHTLEHFHHYDPLMQIILVLADEHRAHWQEILKIHPLTFPVRLATGGQTRYQSVSSGLSLVPDDALVAIHDAARPVLSRQLLDRCFQHADKFGNAVPVIPVQDSIRRQEGEHTVQVNRSHYFLAQTPQCFHAVLLKKAYEKGYLPTFTDDASVLEDAGHIIHTVEGDPENIKITWPSDLQIAEVLLNKGN